MTKQSDIQRLLETFYPTPLTGIPPFTAHPFYPIATLLPSYVPNTLSPIEMLAIFFSILGVWMYGALLYARATSSIGKLSSKDQAWVLWFAASGIIHMTFEGYFAFFSKHMAGSNYVEAQMWKMYSLADSRYITSDSFTVLMEGFTAVMWGPLSTALAFYMIPKGSPYRYVTQFGVSLGQFYGLYLYYGIPILDEILGGQIKAVSRPEAIYYWGEFVGLNFPWAVIPSIAMYSSVKHIGNAFKVAQAVQNGHKRK